MHSYLDALGLGEDRDGGGCGRPTRAHGPSHQGLLLTEVRRLAREPLGRSELTGLPDGRTLALTGGLLLDWLNRTGGRGLFALFQFPALDDVFWALGQRAGLEAWRQIGARLAGVVPETSVLGHALAGPVFHAWGVDSREQALAAMERIVSAFDAPFDLGDRRVFLHANAGALVYPDDSGPIEDRATLTNLVGTALASLPAGSRRMVARWSADARARMDRDVWIDQLLLDGEARARVRHVYQPRFRLDDGRCVGAEALLRWTAPRLGDVAPSEFVPIAERNGAILDLTARLLERVACQVGVWGAAMSKDFRVGVNVSSTLLRSVGTDLVDLVRETLARTGCPPSRLEVELTEAAVLDGGSSTARAVVEGWRDLGVSVALDDFGSGFSSLALLGELPLDLLKLDRSVAAAYERNPEDRRLLDAIAATAGAFDLPVVVEGVERRESIPVLREMGFAMVQGYAVGPPLDASSLARRMRWLPAAAPRRAPDLAGARRAFLIASR